MSGEPGKRRSVFRVDVHLGEHPNVDEALTAWERDVLSLQATRPRKADKLRAKKERLKELMCQ
ncbi:MAG TPA: hypothetical protein VKA73_14470, partial [Rubrobacter sp.]|nr:hypothetical protein [Rubrobacter sp.]